MKLRKNWKRFWTLNRHHAEGFTLVELIVVIAILAILGGVAVPAYSGYVKKANMQADMTLVSDVADALTLYYYSHPTDGVTGYVVLKPNGAVATSDGTVGSAAMQAVFGDGWQNTATLKYDGWSDNELVSLVAKYSPEQLEQIANSSYLTTATPTGMMKAVTGLTGMANVVISEHVDNLDEAIGHLETIFGEGSSIVTKLEDDLKVTNSDDYSTIISNLLVNEMSASVATEPALQAMINLYAAAYAYGETTGEYGAYNAMTEKLESIDMSILSSNDANEGFNYMASVLDVNDMEHFNFMCYMDPSADPNYVPPENEDDAVSKFTNDMAALSTMMGAVQQISGGFADKDSLLNADLFTTDEVMSQVNDYINSVKALAEMDEHTRAQLADLSSGSVAVFITKDGTVSGTPNAAFLQG